MRSSSKTAFESDACDSVSIWSPSTTLAAVICLHISDNALISIQLKSILKYIIPIL